MENIYLISTDTWVKQNREQLLISEVGTELVIMNIETGKYVTLNNQGHLIWKLIEKPVKVSALIAHLTEQFAVSEAECTKDTLEYLQKIKEENLIILDTVSY